jgi:hypothetical protein
MIHYIYKLVHTNGRYYIGRHTTKNLDDGYMGSGKWPRSIKNKQELSKKILSYYDSTDELLEAEKSLLTEHVGKRLCMNFNNNPVGFSSGELNPAKTEKERLRKLKQIRELNPMFGKTHSDTSKKQMSESRKDKPTWNKGMSGVKTSDKGQTAWNKGIHTGHQSFTGKTHSAESIMLMKEKHANRQRITCPHCNKNIDKPNYSRYHGDKCKFNLQ